MRRLLGIPVSIIGLLAFSYGAAQVKSNRADLRTVLASDWKKDEEVLGWIQGPDHYYFLNREDIDLNVVPMDEDLRASLDKSGKEEFLRQTMSGKNKINEMFDVGQSELLDADFYISRDVATVVLFTQQMLGSEKVFVLEKYFMKNGQALHLELRWRAKSDPNAVEKAKASFEKIDLDRSGSK